MPRAGNLRTSHSRHTLPPADFHVPARTPTNKQGITMRKLSCLLALVGASCLWSAGAVGQTKVAWSDSCSKADPDYTVQVGDPGSHSFGLGQLKCHATKPAEIGGDKGKEAVVTSPTESSGNKSHQHGIYVLSMESGDKVSLPYQGTT